MKKEHYYFQIAVTTKHGERTLLLPNRRDNQAWRKSFKYQEDLDELSSSQTWSRSYSMWTRRFSDPSSIRRTSMNSPPVRHGPCLIACGPVFRSFKYEEDLDELSSSQTWSRSYSMWTRRFSDPSSMRRTSMNSPPVRHGPGLIACGQEGFQILQVFRSFKYQEDLDELSSSQTWPLSYSMWTRRFSDPSSMRRTSMNSPPVRHGPGLIACGPVGFQILQVFRSFKYQEDLDELSSSQTWPRSYSMWTRRFSDPSSIRRTSMNSPPVRHGPGLIACGPVGFQILLKYQEDLDELSSSQTWPRSYSMWTRRFSDPSSIRRTSMNSPPVRHGPGLIACGPVFRSFKYEEDLDELSSSQTWSRSYSMWTRRFSDPSSMRRTSMNSPPVRHGPGLIACGQEGFQILQVFRSFKYQEDLDELSSSQTWPLSYSMWTRRFSDPSSMRRTSMNSPPVRHGPGLIACGPVGFQILQVFRSFKYQEDLDELSSSQTWPRSYSMWTRRFSDPSSIRRTSMNSPPVRHGPGLIACGPVFRSFKYQEDLDELSSSQTWPRSYSMWTRRFSDPSSIRRTSLNSPPVRHGPCLIACGPVFRSFKYQEDLDELSSSQTWSLSYSMWTRRFSDPSSIRRTSMNSPPVRHGPCLIACGPHVDPQVFRSFKYQEDLDELSSSQTWPLSYSMWTRRFSDPSSIRRTSMNSPPVRHGPGLIACGPVFRSFKYQEDLDELSSSQTWPLSYSMWTRRFSDPSSIRRTSMNSPSVRHGPDLIACGPAGFQILQVSGGPR
ncbi:hypothetical protein RRG08_062106 [Elysia crispata]|uniref:Uncharacterized protein n=1 Tax=Elysia crispata TaxID=231223 RepID=A0AAE1E5F6_9GAST|nr:hypothetical protein RRG08_062106 [Elysia crispata]